MGYVCIHGHFYQPPRENPWLEAIELQDSAYPYHDWNERVTAECYAPNSAARILNADKRIVRIVNNYQKISFNFGPTLLSWMERNSPRVHRAILQADQTSKERFSGHGSAMAQAYHHIIMPLANPRDKHTQVAWGIRDFEHRFGRFPEGMWLPETAVDVETLEILAKLGIKFTILAPRQARQEGKIGGRSWKDVSGEQIDPSMPYRLDLPSGRKINLFFYDGPISRAVAFEDLLANGEGFAGRLMAGFAEDLRPWPELVHIATDGETYGHHHQFGEMALASALAYIESNQLAQLTNYGEYLERHPPIHRVEIIEDSSWSCIHGIERWRSNCGCNSGGQRGWNQEWRHPLREALDWLRDTLAAKYEQRAQALLKDPWAARNDYIDVVLDRSVESVDRFFAKHALRELDSKERVASLKLLELQRHTMLMYTSCGWFFDEISGIETVQVLHYAGRAIDLAQQAFGDELEVEFLQRLAKAKSNVPEHGDGARIYERFVRPSRVDLLKVATHYAVSSIFEAYGERTALYCYVVDREECSSRHLGDAKLVTGKARFTSTVTQESATFDFGAVHLGEHHLAAGVRASGSTENRRAGLNDLIEAFSRNEGKASPAEIRSCLRQVFGEVHSVQALFRDEQRRILGFLSNSVLVEVDSAHRQIYERHAEFMRFLTSSGMPLPKSFQAAARSALNSFLRDALTADEVRPDRVSSLLAEAKALDIILDAATLEFVTRKRIERMTEAVATNIADVRSIEELQKAVALARSLPFTVDLWWVQTLCHQWIGHAYREFRTKAQAGDENAQIWISETSALSEQLLFLHPNGETVPSPADDPLSQGIQKRA
jgi:alpha-amylase/alpha-mannosidase (GH57 family)